MSADSMYSDDWNSCLTGSQMNAWNLEDDITRIGSRAEDYLSGIWGADSNVSKRESRWKAHSGQDSDPFRQFQTPPSGRTSPTPLADLYSQSIYQAEVDSDSWQAPEQSNCTEPTDELDEEESGSPNVKNVDCMPQDLFSFSQPETTSSANSSSLETLNRSLTENDNNSPEEEKISSLTSDSHGEYTPKLLEETAPDRSARRPLLSLSIGMSICGVGLVFGAQIMHNTTLVNPGKSLIIAGLIGLFVSVVLQTVNRFGRRRMA